MYRKAWNLIVEKYSTSQYAQESTIQGLWETYFSEFFNYKKSYGEIRPQETIHLGSGKHIIPDIILSADGRDLVDVELKKYSIPFSEEWEKQLKSYMNQLHLSIGVLICKSIYVYVYHYGQNIIKKLEIPFEKNNPDGIRFIELFQKEGFSEKAIEEFIDSKADFEKHVKEIKEKVTAEYVLDLLKKHLEESYTPEEVEGAFKDISINIVKTGLIPPPPPPPTPPLPPKYLFEGVWYYKNRLVLAMVKAYVRDNPSVSYKDLLKAFPRDLQGSYGVVLTYAEAASRTKELRKRFFADAPIHLKDGTVVLVCTQWGSGSIGNFERFIRKAEFFGYKIDGVK